MSDGIYRASGDGTTFNLDQMTVGATFAGKRKIEECPKCKRPGIRWKRTIFAHAVLRIARPSGSEYVEVKRYCQVEAPPKVEDKHEQEGFPFCPKDLL